MANHTLCYSRLFAILVLVAVGITMVSVVEGFGTCSEAMGACGPLGDCDRRCKAKHRGGQAQGDCNLNLCTCYYNNCAPPPPPAPLRRNCTTGLGLCSPQCMDSCCNAKCGATYDHGVGFCNEIGSTNLCTCQYVCFPQF